MSAEDLTIQVEKLVAAIEVEKSYTTKYKLEAETATKCAKDLQVELDLLKHQVKKLRDRPHRLVAAPA